MKYKPSLCASSGNRGKTSGKYSRCGSKLSACFDVWDSTCVGNMACHANIPSPFGDRGRTVVGDRSDYTHPTREGVKRKHFSTALRETSIGACIQAPSSSGRGFWFERRAFPRVRQGNGSQLLVSLEWFHAAVPTPFVANWRKRFASSATRSQSHPQTLLPECKCRGGFSRECMDTLPRTRASLSRFP